MATLTSTSAKPVKNRVHPHKFALWVAMASITMMFAGLTSGYIVRQAQGDWRYFKMPPVFWASTIIIIISSITIWAALRAFRQRYMSRFRMLLSVTLLLGIAFGVCQFIGFQQLYAQPQHMVMSAPGIPDAASAAPSTEVKPVRVDGNPSESFLFIIAGMHLLHILGGIVALSIILFRSYSRRVKMYSATGLEVASQYWHFVDILWIYLFVFLLANQ